MNTVLTACTSDSKSELLQDLPLLLLMTIFLLEANWIFYPHPFSAHVKLSQRNWVLTSIHSLVLTFKDYLLSTFYVPGLYWVVGGNIRKQTWLFPSWGSKSCGKWGVKYRKLEAPICPCTAEAAAAVATYTHHGGEHDLQAIPYIGFGYYVGPRTLNLWHCHFNC